MTCKPCTNGNHDACEKGDCECHLVEQQIAKEIEQEVGRDVALAETVYSNLLYGGSKICGLFTANTSKTTVRVFVQQIIRTYKALQS